MITLHTNHGDIKIALDFENTPKTAENFLNYAKDGFYDGTIFHRVIKDFMIQAGGFTADMTQKPTQDPIENEADKAVKNMKGTIAMARTPDPHSASAQFFINVKDNPFLNFRNQTPNGWGYCVFGNVVEGLDVALAIAELPTTGKAGHQDVPVEPVIIERVTISDDPA